MIETLALKLKMADQKQRKRQKVFLFGLIILLIITGIVSWGSGYSSVGLERVPALFNQTATSKEIFILLGIRLPRILIMALAGGALAMSGALIQNLTRNPLADPALLGINSGAGLGVAFVYLLVPVSTAAFSFAIPLAACIGGLCAACVIYLSAFRSGSSSGLKLVLTGVCMSTALSGFMILLVSAAQREKVEFIVKWLSGNIWGSEYGYAAVMALVVTVTTLVALYNAKGLDLFMLGETTASNLGLETEKLRRITLFAAALMSSVAVAFAGGVSFIGLMAPHMARRLSGPKTQPLLGISAALGSVLLLLADTLGRVIAMPSGIPAGILTAILGAPYLIWLMMHSEQ